MLFKQMQYFVAVKEYNSFTEAAEQLYVSQSAVSQQIRALEQDLGVELIHRENRNFHLTIAGEYFYRHCRLLLDEAEELCKETKRIAENDEARIKIGYLKSCSSIKLQQAFSDFSKLYPEVNIEIVNGTHEELFNLIRTGEADVVLNDQRRAFSDEYINYELYSAKCYIEVSINNKISEMEKITLSELKNMPCIIIASKSQQEIEVDYAQNVLGYTGNFLFAENLEEARLMVISNCGFLIGGNMGEDFETSKLIKRVPLYQNEHPLKRKFCAFWQKKKSGYYIEEFVDMLHKILIK